MFEKVFSMLIEFLWVLISYLNQIYCGFVSVRLMLCGNFFGNVSIWVTGVWLVCHLKKLSSNCTWISFWMLRVYLIDSKFNQKLNSRSLRSSNPSLLQKISHFPATSKSTTTSHHLKLPLLNRFILQKKRNKMLIFLVIIISKCCKVVVFFYLEFKSLIVVSLPRVFCKCLYYRVNFEIVLKIKFFRFLFFLN